MLGCLSVGPRTTAKLFCRLLAGRLSMINQFVIQHIGIAVYNQYGVLFIRQIRMEPEGNPHHRPAGTLQPYRVDRPEW